MVEHADWESLELCLLNFLDKCEIDSEEITYPIVVNLFNCTEMALSVVLAMADAADDDRQPFFRDLGECFREIYRYWWQELSKIESRTTSAVDFGTPCRIRGPRGGRPSFDIPPSILEELRGLGFTWTCIAKMLNVSRSTINRRVADHGLQDAGKFSEITDAELDHLTQDYISRHGPTIGQSYLIGQLRSLGLRVQRDRVRSSLTRVDPDNTALRWASVISRRVYSVPWPNVRLNLTLSR